MIILFSDCASLCVVCVTQEAKYGGNRILLILNQNLKFMQILAGRKDRLALRSREQIMITIIAL